MDQEQIGADGTQSVDAPVADVENNDSDVLVTDELADNSELDGDDSSDLEASQETGDDTLPVYDGDTEQAVTLSEEFANPLVLNSLEGEAAVAYANQLKGFSKTREALGSANDALAVIESPTPKSVGIINELYKTKGVNYAIVDVSSDSALLASLQALQESRGLSAVDLDGVEIDPNLARIEALERSLIAQESAAKQAAQVTQYASKVGETVQRAIKARTGIEVPMSVLYEAHAKGSRPKSVAEAIEGIGRSNFDVYKTLESAMKKPSEKKQVPTGVKAKDATNGGGVSVKAALSDSASWLKAYRGSNPGT